MQAKIIHERTLPNTFPVISGVSFAKHYQPAENIGGDFYDIVHLGNKVVMYVSDVSGHGLDSAFLSAFVKNTVDGYMTLCNSQEISAQGILEYLAKQYGKSGYPEEFFISMFVAVFNLETNILTYCGAGFQEEPLACLAGQENITLPAPGLPISLALPPEVLVFEENSLFIPPNSTLLIYSDGLAEQEVGGICYREFLKETFNKFCSLSAHELIEAINENFLNFNGSLQGKDDITFIVFKT